MTANADIAVGMLLGERDQAVGDLFLLGRPLHRLSCDVVGR
ncbi:hypothetical protein ACWDKQ_00270 [Saccharopolyspora sp. NPDC000995]